MRWAVACFCLLAGPVPAQEQAPTTSLRPLEREASDDASDPDDAVTVSVGQRDLLQLPADEYAACLATLESMGVSFKEVDPIIPSDDRDCGILQPLEVDQIAPGVAIIPPATLRCPTAEALAIWVDDFVLPASERLDDREDLREIRNGSGYICRRRNNAPDGKLSEHAFGNAFDVMSFHFDEGAPIPVQPREADGTMAEAFQDAVRASACLEFATVLGPGSNPQHVDHLHLDIVVRNGGYRICEQGGVSTDEP